MGWQVSAIIVSIPDGKDWEQTVWHCKDWIRTMWPYIREGQTHHILDDGEWGWSLGLRESKWWFRDPNKALMFKLACGGSYA